VLAFTVYHRNEEIDRVLSISLKRKKEDLADPEERGRELRRSWKREIED
jgi:hypothetical protein